MFSPLGYCTHYTTHIADELRSRGAEVRVYDERPSQATAAKIYMYFFRGLAPQYFANYIRKIVRQNKDFNPDVVFVVRGQAFDVTTLEYLKQCYPNAKFLFYQWDPLCGKRIPEILNMYDAAYSFDLADVENNPEFKFRPSLYLNEYKAIASEKCFKYDVSFVGKLYNNRWPVIKMFMDYFRTNEIRSYFYLYMPSWTLYIWDFIRRGSLVSPRKMRFNPMSFLENVDIVKDSKCVLDIVYSKQTGLSMRAFESMAAKRKYITNNSEVEKYDFYNPNNILIVDINNINIPSEFIDSPFEDVDKEILYKYSVSGLVDDLFRNILT